MTRRDRLLAVWLTIISVPLMILIVLWFTVPLVAVVISLVLGAVLLAFGIAVLIEYWDDIVYPVKRWIDEGK